jgi:hypothetical protein
MSSVIILVCLSPPHCLIISDNRKTYQENVLGPKRVSFLLSAFILNIFTHICRGKVVPLLN